MKILEIILIVALVGCVLDVVTTYKGLKDPKAYESNIIFNFIFKIMGLKLGIAFAFILTIWICFDLYINENLVALSVLSVLKLAASYDNHRGKTGYITKTLILFIPIYWNWKKIYLKIQKLFQKTAQNPHKQ